MKIHLSRIYRDRQILADYDSEKVPACLRLTGGDLPHVGAVGMIQTDGSIEIREEAGHKEGILCRIWCEALKRAGCIPLYMEAGIHYDHLPMSGILEVMKLADDLLEELMAELSC